MAGTATENGAQLSHELLSKLSGEFLASLALVFRQSEVYGQGHSVTRKAMERSYEGLMQLLEFVPSIDVLVNENEILVNGSTIGRHTPAVEGLLDRLNDLQIASFSLLREISLQEYNNVAELLNASPEEMEAAGGFAAVVRALGMEHVRATRIILQQISEDDVVVSRGKVAEKFGEAHVGQVIGFLRGEPVDGADEFVLRLQSVAAADAGKLADAVMEAAGTGDGVPSLDKVVDSVRRIYEEVSKSPQAKTQKGKKEIIKLLNNLEEDIAGRLREAGGQGPDGAETLTDAVQGMVDELRIDALAGEYAKKRGAIDASEKRILRFLKSKGRAVLEDAEMRARLEAAGISPEAWDELVAKSEIASEGETGDRLQSAGRLADSLSRLEGVIGALGGGGLAPGGPARDAEQQVTQAVTSVAEQVQTAIRSTEQKIDEYVRKARKAAAEGDTKPLSRKALIEFMAEVVQELRQPLVVITSSVDACRKGMLGAVTPLQVEMLDLANTSADRLDHLVTKLMEVVGLPAELNPDAQILGELYDGSPPQSNAG